MNLIVDAQLPESICEYFADCNCVHTKQLKQGNLTKDSFINELSVKEKCAVITKDTDFYYSYIAYKKPYKLVLVKLGNLRLLELKNYFKSNAKNIKIILEKHSFIILEKPVLQAMLHAVCCICKTLTMQTHIWLWPIQNHPYCSKVKHHD